MIKYRKNIVLIFALFVISSSFAAKTKYWYVSTDQQTTGVGSKDKPFTSLEEARNAIREYRKTHSKKESHIVILDDGHYHLSSTFVLEKKDGGIEGYPVIYRAKNKEKVYISTAPVLSSKIFRKANNKEVPRLHPKAIGNVLVAELSADLVSQFGNGQGNYGALAWNEHMLQLAQWPNRGYNLLDKVVDIGPTLRWLKTSEKEAPYSYEKPTGGKFTIKEETDFSLWKAELERTWDIRQDGYLSIDWAKDPNQLARVSENGEIQLLDATRYGVGGVKYTKGYSKDNPKPKFLKNRRLVFLNVLCELDMPGEWYVDRLENKLYLWPVDQDIENATIAIPSGPKMLELKNTNYVKIEGIIFENGGEKVLNIDGGSHNEIAGCTFRNLQGMAATVNGTKNGFRSCNFYNMNTCLSITGGDFKTLEKCNNYVVNCDFHDFKSMGYGAISLVGCGMTFENNIVHQISSGIWYSGFYIEFRNNEFFDVGWGMGDWNILYQGANIWCNGNIIENNFFHNMFGHPGIAHPIIAIRNDDGGSGTTYRSNVFYKTGKGSIVTMGPSCHIKDNIAIDCGTIWRTNKRPITPEAIEKEYEEIRVNFESGKFPRGNKEDRIYNAEQAIGKEGWNKEPFKSAFPDFAKYMKENPFAQSYSSIVNSYSDQVDKAYPYNIFYIHGSFQLTESDGGIHHKKKMEVAFPKSFKYNAPRKISKTDFVDYKSLDFTLKPEFETFSDFKACDMSKIGLYKDAYRTNPPSSKAYRSALYEKNRFRLSEATGLGYPKDAYKLYPIQSWMEEEPIGQTAYPFLSGIDDIGWVADKGPRRDSNYRGGTITIANKKYDYGITLKPNKDKGQSEIVFDLSEFPKIKGLKATIGIDDNYGKGSSSFIVMAKKGGEWRELYKSEEISKGEEAKDIKVALKGYNTLKLIGKGKAVAIWANAAFTE